MKKINAGKFMVLAQLLWLFMPSNTANAASLPQRMNIDNPNSNMISNSDLYVVGWALDDSGIKTVKVYVDGNLNGNATLGQSRPDVNNVFPGYPGGSTSGYSYKVSANALSEGQHSIKVEAIGNDGSSLQMTKSVQVNKLQMRGNLDEPLGGIETKDISVRGWALNPSGLKEVKVYLDGTFNANASIGMARPDIAKAFPSYVNGDKSGFSYTIDSTGLKSGSHTVKVEAIGNDGSSQTYSKTIQYTKLASRIQLDEPQVLLTDNKDFKVRGWALHAYGVKTVKIYLDNKLLGNATKEARPDVNAAFPGYKDGVNSGYTFSVGMNYVAPGTHTVKVEAIGTDGESMISTKNIEIRKLKPLSTLDEPFSNQLISATDFTVRGWAVNASGVNTVKVLIDGRVVGTTKTENYRPDINSIYSSYINAAYSGYAYKVSTLSLKPGKHSLAVESIGNDGTKTVDSIEFVFKGLYDYVQYNNTLDYYVNVQMKNSSPIVYESSSNSRNATSEEVKYYMNPTNFAEDSYGKYMFMKLSYTDGITAANLNKVLQGKGVLSGKGEVFLKAGQTYNVNPIYLVAHALLETGNGTSKLASGKIIVSELHNNIKDENGEYQAVFDQNVAPKAIYNMYGIGAYDSNADMWGAERAYREGWFNVDSAIIGGAKWIAEGYIANATYKQDTLYEMRWNLTTTWHQYATDIGWAYKQINKIKQLVDTMDNPIIYYEIPVFK